MIAHSVQMHRPSERPLRPGGPSALEPGAQWLRQAGADPRPFAELYDEYYPKIFGFIMRTVMNVDVAEDITGEAFMKALLHLQTYNPRIGSFSSWLYRIAANAMNDHFRKAANRTPIPEQSLTYEQLIERGVLPRTQSGECLERFERYNRLHQAIAELKPHYRVTIMLFYFEEKSLKEIALIMQCTVVAVKWRLHQGRKLLAEKLDFEP